MRTFADARDRAATASPNELAEAANSKPAHRVRQRPPTRVRPASAGRARLTSHNGEHPWHLHADGGDNGPRGEWFVSSSALALAMLLARTTGRPRRDRCRAVLPGRVPRRGQWRSAKVLLGQMRDAKTRRRPPGTGHLTERHAGVHVDQLRAALLPDCSSPAGRSTMPSPTTWSTAYYFRCWSTVPGSSQVADDHLLLLRRSAGLVSPLRRENGMMSP